MFFARAPSLTAGLDRRLRNARLPGRPRAPAPRRRGPDLHTASATRRAPTRPRSSSVSSRATDSVTNWSPGQGVTTSPPARSGRPLAGASRTPSRSRRPGRVAERCVRSPRTTSTASPERDHVRLTSSVSARACSRESGRSAVPSPCWRLLHIGAGCPGGPPPGVRWNSGRRCARSREAKYGSGRTSGEGSTLPEVGLLNIWNGRPRRAVSVLSGPNLNSAHVRHVDLRAYGGRRAV